ncbi:methyltransferase [Arthrobacter sp. Hiyo4]|nr:methyltransferase [Arthrobacter sp. Hiyo4]
MVSAWLAGTGASEWKVRHLLEPICREGRRPSMGTREEYEAMAAAAGFAATGYEDVSRRVARTWRICAGHPRVILGPPHCPLIIASSADA